MSADAHLRLGQWGEKVAADYLKQQGYILLGLNIRTPYGEIDILARQEDTLVFVEVKTRRSASLGYPEISITPQKFSHMVSAAESHLLEHPELTLGWRIDVISIRRKAQEELPEIVHFENVNDVS
jgi:putative endonuclease